MGRTGPIASCYECAGMLSCYGTKQLILSREEGRDRAGSCRKLEKGRTVEVVRVMGRQRGMSRRNAQESVEAGKAVWEGQGLVRLLEEK